MRPVKLFLLTALHDHMLRMGEAEHIVKAAYLVIAREIARLDLRDRGAYLIGELCEKLKVQATTHESLNHALSYVWVYDDIRGEMYKDNAKRAEKLIERITDGYYPGGGGRTTQSDVQYTILRTLFEVSSNLDTPIMFATDDDLLCFRIWFTGDMEDVDMHERWCHMVEDEAEWNDLLKKFPSTRYLWRQDHEPFIPENMDWEYHDQSAWYKNISILSLDKLYAEAKLRLCGDDECELYTVTH